MKKYLLLVTILFLVWVNVSAQNMQWAWARATASSTNEIYIKVATDSRNGVYAFGTFDGPSLTVGGTVLTGQGSTDLLLTKYDSLGNIIWAKSFGSTGAEMASDIETDLSGNIIITGSFTNSMNMGSIVLTSAGGTDAFVAKISGNGNLIWAKNFTGNQDDAGYVIITDRQNNIYIAGRYSSTNFQFIDTLLTNANPQNGFYGKLDSNGNRRWARKITCSSSQVFFDFRDMDYYYNSEKFVVTGFISGLGSINFTTLFTSPGIITFGGLYHIYRAVIDSSGGFVLQEFLGMRTSKGAGCIDENDNYYYGGAQNQQANGTTNIGAPWPFIASPIGTSQGTQLTTPYSSSEVYDLVKLDQKVYALGSQAGDIGYSNGFTLQSDYECNYFWQIGFADMGTQNVFHTPFRSGFSFNNVSADTVARVLYAAGKISGAAGQTASLSNDPNTQISLGGASDAVISKIYVNRQLPFYLNNVERTNISICRNSEAAIGSPRAASGGTPPYTYSWSPATGLKNPNSPYTKLVNLSANAAYVLTATDAAGNTASADTVHVDVLPAVPTPTISANGPLALCPGGSVTLTSTPAYRYRWNTSNPGDTLQSLTVSTQRINYVNAIDTNGCRSLASNTLEVTIPSTNAPTITIGGSATICQGQSVTLTSSIANSYLWSNGAITRSITVTTAGNYSVITTNSAGCTMAPSDTVTVTVNPRPNTLFITASGPLSFCEGGFVTLTSSSADNYLWSNGAVSQSITVNQSGNYSVVTTNSAGCRSAPSETATVTVNPLPSTPTVTANGPLSFCEGDSVYLVSTAANGYLWNNSSVIQYILVTTPGSYSVVTTNSAGCSSASSNVVTVTVNPLPGIPLITANGPLSFCEGGSVQLTSTSANGYLWSNAATTQTITATTTGNYSVVTSNSAGCNSATSNILSVTVNQNPPVPVITQSGNTLSSNAATGNQWYFNGTIISGATSQTYNYVTPGQYTVTVTDANGCSSSSLPHTGNFVNGSITILSNGEEFMHRIAPNPVNNQASINYQLQSAADISIQIIAINGSKTIQLLPPIRQAAGYYRVEINRQLLGLQTGLYIVKYLIDGETVTEKLLVNK